MSQKRFRIGAKNSEFLEFTEMDGIFTEKYDKKMDYIFSIIFGNTDDEEEGFQGFTEEDVKLATKRAKKKYKKFKSLVLGKGIIFPLLLELTK
ncbi:hypothetical protein AVEN_235065-1 [Araneus ventricosus]|uniref:Uncharacterized protein n=1 Tax=Araneus ventricosus TaxID=182803 RepID=A0A4Y2F1C4_ARAVE|nr:hypothetical protein AVEN_235065-1 [Araneus ventricosus]